MVILPGCFVQLATMENNKKISSTTINIKGEITEDGASQGEFLH
jgi:hypothetical protein